MSLTHCAATMPGLRGAIKMVARLLLPGVAGQTGSRGGANRGQRKESAAVTHLPLCNAMDAVRWMVDVLQKQAPVITVFCSRSECASLCTCSSCNNFHKSPAHSWPIRTTLAGDL